MNESDGREGIPLQCVFEDGVLKLQICAKTLTFAFENNEGNNPYDDDLRDFKRLVSINDAMIFAEDICREMNREEEDGSTPLTRFLDSMMEEAVNQGSLAISDPEDEVLNAD